MTKALVKSNRNKPNGNKITPIQGEPILSLLDTLSLSRDLRLLISLISSKYTTSVNRQRKTKQNERRLKTAVRSSDVSLPVARTTGWSSGSSGGHRACKGRRAAGESVCLPPSRGGWCRSSPAWATLWGSARHPPPIPATASTCFALCPPRRLSRSFRRCHPLRCSRYPFCRGTTLSSASSCLSSSHPLVPCLPLGEAISYRRLTLRRELSRRPLPANWDRRPTSRHHASMTTLTFTRDRPLVIQERIMVPGRSGFPTFDSCG